MEALSCLGGPANGIGDPHGTRLGREAAGERRAPVLAHRIDHVGTCCRVRFIQDDFFCPMFRVEGSPVSYVLLEEGSFSIRLDSDIYKPIVAKMEVNGRLFSSEYRILANGSRIVREVHEHRIATRRNFMYRSLVVFDNVLQREVTPGEMELETVEEADEFTSLIRVLFLPVRGGMTATRGGSWRINYKREPLAVEMIRIGHRALLAKLFGVQLNTLVNSMQQASISKASSLSRPPSRAESPICTGSYNSRRIRGSDANIFLPIRSKSSISVSSRPPSRSDSMECGSRFQASSPTFLPKSSSVVQSVGSYGRRASSGGIRHAARSPSPRGGRMKPETETMSTGSLNSPPLPSVLRIKPTPRIKLPPPLHPQLIGSSRSSSPAVASREKFSSSLQSHNIRNGKRVVEENGHNNNSFHICVKCNAVFDRERLLYNQIVTRLKEKVVSLEQENAKLRMGCSDAFFAIRGTGSEDQSVETSRVEDLDATLSPSRIVIS
ncbi:hypothetical protein MOQ_000355 [Trypanosoma cruzi marinkellei]|uniref:Uncharacterized protein n=1 Tax=Trypanosoma cruzi marinkellei TaxID=85056 RepID=K2NNM5_TRYCR|nr:hypothetical protein MOQ_000355 [Trypanosoma cruzi marinkellei]